MKLQSFKRLNKSDFDNKYEDLIDTLSSSINIAFDNILEALNNKTSLTDNIACTVGDITAMTDASGNPTTSISLKLNSNNVKVLGCQVINAINLTNGAIPPTGCPFITFTQNANTITINNIQGLPINNNFQLKVIAWYA